MKRVEILVLAVVAIIGMFGMVHLTGTDLATGMALGEIFPSDQNIAESTVPTTVNPQVTDIVHIHHHTHYHHIGKSTNEITGQVLTDLAMPTPVNGQITDSVDQTVAATHVHYHTHHHYYQGTEAYEKTLRSQVPN